MNFADLLANITPDIYANLQRAVELGKWPTGQALTREQRETCMQAMIAYERMHLPPEAHTGYIPPEPHSYCGSDDHDHDHAAPDAEQPLTWIK